MAHGRQPRRKNLQRNHPHLPRHPPHQTLHTNQQKHMITKQELVDILEQLYRSYNDALPGTTTSRKQILTAWWEVLNDLETNAIKQAIRHHQIATPTFMPRPMEIRILATDLTNPNPPPTPAEAWKTYLEIVSAGVNGNWTPTQHHPALQKTIATLAPAKLTNSGKDRDFFLETYKQNLTTWRIQQQPTN